MIDRRSSKLTGLSELLATALFPLRAQSVSVGKSVLDSVFLVQLLSGISCNTWRKSTGQDKHVQRTLNIKSEASVSANGLQKCRCEGFALGRGG